MRPRATPGILAAVVLLAACARPADRAGPTRSPARTAGPIASIGTPTPWGNGPKPARRRVIDLGRLPARGVALGIERRRVVLFIGLNGRVLDRLPRSTLEYGNGSVPGAVVVAHGGVTYRLDARRGRLTRTEEQPAALIDQGDGDVPLAKPIGSMYEGTRQGSWRWAERSPDGSEWLAQWSGECESPSVYLVRDGERPVSITGPRSVARAVEAFALGWTPDGRAIVQLLRPVCGRGFPEAGVYAFAEPGRGQLVFATKEPAYARMWGAA